MHSRNVPILNQIGKEDSEKKYERHPEITSLIYMVVKRDCRAQTNHQKG